MNNSSLFEVVDKTWQPIVNKAFAKLDPEYLKIWGNELSWLPSLHRVFAAFSIPKNKVQYVLLGESPYPRPNSANGYAFWDNAVHGLWSSSGLSKEVNRATSLRNFIKMLLRAEGLLLNSYTQNDIQNMSKINLVETLDALFLNLIDRGFLLLNASLIWSKDKPMRYHAKHWQPFVESILRDLMYEQRLRFLLFGKVAQKFKFLPSEQCIIAEHPYVLSFIENPEIINFFKPLHLLRVE